MRRVMMESLVITTSPELIFGISALLLPAWTWYGRPVKPGRLDVSRTSWPLPGCRCMRQRRPFFTSFLWLVASAVGAVPPKATCVAELQAIPVGLQHAMLFSKSAPPPPQEGHGMLAGVVRIAGTNSRLLGPVAVGVHGNPLSQASSNVICSPTTPPAL